MNIADTLIEKIKQTENPTVVGLDPRLSYIPGFITEEAYDTHGKTLQGAASAVFAYNRMLIDELYDIIPAVKPQIAMYERFGAEGIAAYIQTVRYAKEKGLVVIGDIKRSDIASTAEAYSDAHIGRTTVGDKAFEVFAEDFVTLNAYLGIDSIQPFLDDCKRYNKGLFILTKTSNPNSGQIQDLMAGGLTIYEHMGLLTAQWGEAFIGQNGFSAIGAVVGATHREQAAALRKRLPHTFFLVPGYGAQGGTAEDLAVCFNKEGLGAIVNSSRGIIAAHQTEPYRDFSPEDFAKAAREACIKMKQDLGRCV